MVRTRTKWKCVLLINIILFSVFTRSLPIESNLQSLKVIDSVFPNTEFSELPVLDLTNHRDRISSESATNTLVHLNAHEENVIDANAMLNNTRSILRPEQTVRSYQVEISFNGGSSFTGRVIIDVDINEATRDDELLFHVEDLNILSVRTGLVDINTVEAPFDVDDGILSIDPLEKFSTYNVIIEYTGSMNSVGGLYRGNFNDMDYIAMNLHATNARRVFPCDDDFGEQSVFSFTFNNNPYNNIVMNSALQENSANSFLELSSPASLWGMMAHNFNNINNPITNVQLVARPGVVNQEYQASTAINYYFTHLGNWTAKDYTEISSAQDGRMLVIALPDVHKDWYALSTVCIWEPYLLMERLHSVKQRKEALTEIAEAMTRQWFGYVIFPENWRFQWVVTGLSGYAAYDLNRQFQSTPGNTDQMMLDFNTIFVSDVIQEALYRDAYAIAQPLEHPNILLDENEEIRPHIYGLKLLKYKAPAIMNMLSLILSDETQDFVKSAAQLLITGRSLETVNSIRFVDAIRSGWLTNGNAIVEDLLEFVEPWIQNNGYPTIHVSFRQGGVLVTQETFGYSDKEQVDYRIPITWTSSINPNFDTSNIRPESMMGSTAIVNVLLGEDDFVLFNIQGQGYYRVNYVTEMWDRIIEALQDPERREMIHPLNRATLVDDALNLARAGKTNYETAFLVVLSMEHEIEYPVWKAFVRNMNFLRKRLMAYVDDDDDDRDKDIYLRMVRRTVGRVENELGFYPDYLAQGTENAMESLTRGLVMEHACKAGYQPCIAAAVDWFWDPNNNEVVNPNIPYSIRPAVFCTMVREGGSQALNALYTHLESESVMYERLVIIESLACSQDGDFVRTLLQETLADDSPWSLEERNRLFTAIAESSFANAGIALNFMTSQTAAIRAAYGGHEKLEELIWILAENMADDGLSGDFRAWVTFTLSQLNESEETAIRANNLVEENVAWDKNNIEFVYEWIDDNGAPGLVASLLLIFASCFVAMNNRSV